VEFGVQLLTGGEVSPYLFELKAGDHVEIKGPLGRHFVWNVNMPGPLVLIGGGSGMVPLMSMLRHYACHGDAREIVFLISAQTIDHVLYHGELDKISKEFPNVKIAIILTEEQPALWKGYNRRIDEAMLRETIGHLAAKMPRIYVSGSTPFVEAVTNLLPMVGFKLDDIRTERFGGTEVT